MSIPRTTNPPSFEPLKSNRAFLWSGALIVAGVIAIAISLFRVQETVLEQERRQMLLIAHSAVRSIDNYVNGCLEGVRLLAKIPSFHEAVAVFRSRRDSGPLLPHLLSLASEKFPAVDDAYLVDSRGNALLGSSPPDEYLSVVGGLTSPDDGKIRVFKRKNGSFYMGVILPIDGDDYLLTLLRTDALHQKTTSSFKLGTKGYVMLKHSSGVILTHPVPQQVGLDVIEGRRAGDPTLDYSELERLVANQKTGKEGIEVYHSYWWADKRPVKVKKISAYGSVPIQNDFIIVSAVSDYAEMLEFVLGGSATMVAAAIFVTLGVMGLLLNRHRELQRQVERENAFLRELNVRQEQNQHNQRLQMIGTLTGGIAHEFRNLLTPIMGYSGMMRESLPSGSPLREDVDEIYASAAKAKELIQQITSLSRKNLEPVLAPLLLDDVLPGMVKVALTSKPPEAKMHLAADFGRREILGNRTQLNQVILNLCNNAFQALPGGRGNVWITGSVQTEEKLLYAVLVFRDDGVGMKPEVVGRIFDPFFTTKRVGEGTGLGLSVVQNIVDIHHGTIQVESSPDAGTAFTLRFPVVAASRTSGRYAPARVRPEGDPVTIVLVEDDEHVLRLLHRGLAKHGFSTQAFSQPADALHEMRKNPCRLLIADYNLPGMTGTELARRVKKNMPATKILLLTGYADAAILDDVQAGVVDGYQIKPVPVSELVERINSLFE